MDRYQDYAVSAPAFGVSGVGQVGRDYIYSELTGQVVQTLEGIEPGAQFGDSRVDIGDATGDGIRDLVLAAESEYGLFGISVGTVSLYNSATGAREWTFYGEVDVKTLGRAFAVTTDNSGDDTPDVVATGHGMGGVGKGRLYFINGATVADLGKVTGDLNFTGSGFSVEALPDSPAVITTDGYGAAYSISSPALGSAARTEP